MDTRMQSPVGARTIFNGREVDYFAGTGYLGLQSHPEVLQAAVDALLRYGLSTATSRGGLGEHPIYDELEQEASKFFGCEKVLYYASGYMGSAVLTQSTSNQFDHIFIDSSAHFSLWDAAQATNLPITPFEHLQPQSLKEQLAHELRPSTRPLILSDGVFPISGEIAPLPDYLALAKSYNGKVYLDDAHAVGVLGQTGRGTAQHFNITDTDCRTCATFSKALGGFGGVIWGESDWIKLIEKSSRICAGSSAVPLPAAAASARALNLFLHNPAILDNLRSNVSRARQGLNALGWDIGNSPIPILCLGAKDGINLDQLQKKLFEKGIAVKMVRGYSSTPAGGALRIAIFATHTPQQIDRLLSCMKDLM